MSNLCHNLLTVSGGTSEQLKQFVHATMIVPCDNDNNISYSATEPVFTLNALVPVPSNITAPDAKSQWKKQNWGIPYDIRGTVKQSDFLWDSSNTSVSLNFDTSYIPPHLWMEKVCKMFPHLDFELLYSEYYGNLSGSLICHNGNMTYENSQLDFDYKLL